MSHPFELFYVSVHEVSSLLEVHLNIYWCQFPLMQRSAQTDKAVSTHFCLRWPTFMFQNWFWIPFTWFLESWQVLHGQAWNKCYRTPAIAAFWQGHDCKKQENKGLNYVISGYWHNSTNNFLLYGNAAVFYHPLMQQPLQHQLHHCETPPKVSTASGVELIGSMCCRPFLVSFCELDLLSCFWWVTHTAVCRNRPKGEAHII